MSTALAILLIGFLAEPDPVVLTGQVAQANGSPVAGAEVILAQILMPPGGPTTRNAVRIDTRTPVVLGRVRTDESGKFALPIRDVDDPLFNRNTVLWTSKDGSAAAFRPIPPYWPKDGEPIRLTLGPPHAVDVRVVGPDGRPVGRVRVAPARLRRLMLYADLSETAAIEVNGEGRGVLTAIAPEEIDLLRVTSGAFGTQVVRAERGQGGERLARLLAVGRVEGRVKCNDLEAIRGLPVFARTWTDPAAKEDGIGGVAESVLDDQGRFVLPAIAEGTLAVQVEPLPELPYRKQLARIDGPAAIALDRDFVIPYDNRYFDGIAASPAARDPAAAEEALGHFKDKRIRDNRIARVAGQMAVADMARARRMVESVDGPIYKAKGFGAMARGLARTDPKAAAALIDDAVRLLDQAARGSGTQSTGSEAPCSIAASMLPLVERLGDPALLERCLWRSIALRPPRPSASDPSTRYEETIACLAIGLSRYDRGLARKVLEPIAGRAGSIRIDQRFAFSPTLYYAAAMIDPDWAVELANKLPEDVPEAKARPRSLARQAIAQTLAHGGPKWWVYADEKLGRFDSDHPDEY